MLSLTRYSSSWNQWRRPPFFFARRIGKRSEPAVRVAGPHCKVIFVPARELRGRGGAFTSPTFFQGIGVFSVLPCTLSLYPSAPSEVVSPWTSLNDISLLEVRRLREAFPSPFPLLGYVVSDQVELFLEVSGGGSFSVLPCTPTLYPLLGYVVSDQVELFLEVSGSELSSPSCLVLRPLYPELLLLRRRRSALP